MGFYDTLKYVFWRVITPFHPYGRDFLLWLGIIKHDGRQEFLLGTLASGKTPEGLIRHLKKYGFGNHFIAWVDDGQLYGLRKRLNFREQYHLRIFRDGEVRGHFEYTPEYHPIYHMKEVGMEKRAEEFAKFLGNWIIPSSETPSLRSAHVMEKSMSIVRQPRSVARQKVGSGVSR